MSFLLQCEPQQRQQTALKAQHMPQGFPATIGWSSLPEAPDMYQEDECDVGPRAFRQPLIPETCGAANPRGVAQVFHLYNEALSAHARLDYVTATRLYKAITHCCFQDTQAHLAHL